MFGGIGFGDCGDVVELEAVSPAKVEDRVEPPKSQSAPDSGA